MVISGDRRVICDPPNANSYPPYQTSKHTRNLQLLPDLYFFTT